MQLERIDNRPRDLVLDRKNSLQLALESFCPNGESITGVNQFRLYPDAFALAPDAAFKHVAHIQLFRDLAQIRLFVFEPKRRPSRGYAQAIYFRERGENFFGYAVAKIILIGLRSLNGNTAIDRVCGVDFDKTSCCACLSFAGNSGFPTSSV